MRRRKSKGAPASDDISKMSAPLFLSIRPMTLAEMPPEIPYAPGMSVFIIYMPPGMSGGREDGFVIEKPMWLPPEYRASTPENLSAVFAYFRTLEPALCDRIVRQSRAARRKAQSKDLRAP